MQKSTTRSVSIPCASKPVFPEDMHKFNDGVALLEALTKERSVGGGVETKSLQGVRVGRLPQPSDFLAMVNLRDVNTHHSACIDTKVAATVGMGFIDADDSNSPDDVSSFTRPDGSTGIKPEYRRSKVDDVLDPLTVSGWQSVINAVCEDYNHTGNGYLEVRRDKSDNIVGIHHLPATDVWLFLEDLQYHCHYDICGTGDGSDGQQRKFAEFGDREGLLARMDGEGSAAAVPFTLMEAQQTDKETISEVIAIKRPNSQNRFYGIPSWKSAVPVIELVSMLIQYRFDFFLNRGVPEFIALFSGDMDDEQWDAITKQLNSTVGVGATHKSVTINTPGGVELQLEKLALDGGNGDAFNLNKENLANDIVTAHRVPPLLAGILIPGKLGASNELSNALRAFQSLYIGQDQKLFKTVLGQTLGNSDLNGGLGLKPNDFNFVTITDALDLQTMDTASRMREEEGPNRDPSEGLRD